MRINTIGLSGLSKKSGEIRLHENGSRLVLIAWRQLQ